MRSSRKRAIVDGLWACWSRSRQAWAGHNLPLIPASATAARSQRQLPHLPAKAPLSLVIDSQNRARGGLCGIQLRKASAGTMETARSTRILPTRVSRLAVTPSDQVLQADGKIVAVGTDQTGGLIAEDWQVARLLADGSLDASFANAGILTVDWYGSSDEAKSVSLDNTGNIIVGGLAYYPGVGTSFAVLSIDTTGSILHSAATKIYSATADICQDVLVQPDDKILCVGLAREFQRRPDGCSPFHAGPPTRYELRHRWYRHCRIRHQSRGSQQCAAAEQRRTDSRRIRQSVL